MKHRPQDMLDSLKTGEDRVAKVKAIKDELKRMRFTKVRVTRRKLASGEKLYFQVEWILGYLGAAKTLRLTAEDIIRKHFPKARITSAGSDNATFAEY